MGTRMFTTLAFAAGITLLGAGFGADAPADPDEDADGAAVTDHFETLTTNPQLSLFAQAFQTAGIGDRMAEGQEWTIFAPADENLEGASALDSPAAVSNYVVQGAYSVAELWDLAEREGGMATLTTLGGEQITVETFEDTLRIGGVALVVEADIETTNGFVHVIDGPIPMAEAKGRWRSLEGGWQTA